jgi:hypothetical protein
MKASFSAYLCGIEQALSSIMSKLVVLSSKQVDFRLCLMTNSRRPFHDPQPTSDDFWDILHSSQMSVVTWTRSNGVAIDRKKQIQSRHCERRRFRRVSAQGFLQDSQSSDTGILP